MKKDLNDKGLHVHYDDLQFGEMGQLDGLTIAVKAHADSTHHATAEDLSTHGRFGIAFTHDGKEATILEVGDLAPATRE